MKKITQLFLVLFILFTWCGYLMAQNFAPWDKAPNTFTGKRPTYTQPSNPLANTGYGTDAYTSPYPFVSMPIPAGTPWTTLYAGNGIWLAGADIDETTGLYYGCSYIGSLGQSNLVNVDLTTGVPTTVAPITGISQYPVALAYNAATNTWYYGETDGSTSRLYTLDIATGVATFVGTIFSGQLIAIAIDCNGMAYGEEMNTDQLYSIDLTTGVGTAIGYMGFNCTYAQDADFDASTGILYLASYDSNTGTAALRTCDTNTGSTTVVVSWPGTELTGFAIDNTCGPPCPAGKATNPNPATGATNVDINLSQVSWTNGAGVTQIDVWFEGSLVYSGAPVTTWNITPTPLEYNTTYHWKVDSKNDTCTTYGDNWTFTTMQNPNLVEWCDYFTNLNNWTAVGPFGQGNWSASNTMTAGGTPPEMYMSWSPSFTGVSTMRSVVIPDFPNNTLVDYYFRFYLDWFADPSGVVTVGITYDGGTTVNNLYTVSDPTGSVGPLEVSGSFMTPATGSENLQIEATYNGYSFNINWIAFDDMCLTYVVPVELTSFTAKAYANEVELNWTTATETNNQGFDIERTLINSGTPTWEKIGYVAGFGTTTEPKAYSFVDTKLETGKYSYRLKQINLDGTFEYSNAVNVEVEVPIEYALEQNYPNPFNPSTTIKYSIPEDGFVKLAVYNMLGEEVANLVNAQQKAGRYEINFNASNLASGVYVYRIEAANFTASKKLMLMK
jgi:hypothetical protein